MCVLKGRAFLNRSGEILHAREHLERRQSRAPSLLLNVAGLRNSHPGYTTGMFPLDRWYVAGFSWEFQVIPIARTLLNRAVVFFRAGGEMAALEDRCCHRHLPLSCGT